MTETKRSYRELARKLARCPASGAKFRHYQTGLVYVVLGCAIEEATMEPLVLYLPEDEDVMFARPFAEWDEVVEYEGRRVPRFGRVR